MSFWLSSVHDHTRDWTDGIHLDIANSIATEESENAERMVCEWIRDHPRRPITEWSDYADPFEPAGWVDWSPVRSVKLATRRARVAVEVLLESPRVREDREFLRIRREKQRVARAVSALLTGRTRVVGNTRRRIDPPKPRLPRSINVEDIPEILGELRTWPTAGTGC